MNNNEFPLSRINALALYPHTSIFRLGDAAPHKLYIIRSHTQSHHNMLI